MKQIRAISLISSNLCWLWIYATFVRDQLNQSALFGSVYFSAFNRVLCSRFDKDILYFRLLK